MVVSALSRLGRSLGQIVAILDALATADVAFVALKEHIRVEGTRDIQTKVMTTLFALFAEVERDLISERTREGLAQARASGKQRGRPKGALGVSRLDGKEDDLRRVLELGVSKTAIATITGVSRPSLYSFMSTRGLTPSPSRVFLHESCRYPVLENPAPPSPVHAGDGLVGQEARAPVAAELLHESPALGLEGHRRSFRMMKMTKMMNMTTSNMVGAPSLSGLSGLSGALGDGRSATRRPACSRGEDWTPAEPGPHESRQPRDERPTRVHDPAPELAHAVGLADPRVAAVRRHAVASAPAPSTHPVRVGPSTRSTTAARPRPVARSVTPATTLVSAPPRPVRGCRRTLQTQSRASSTGVAREGIVLRASSGPRGNPVRREPPHQQTPPREHRANVFLE